jgi:phosphocarrier protein
MTQSGELCSMARIENARGLHARAAVRFARLAESFRSELSVVKDDMRVSACSIMGLMMLAATTGSSIQICGTGPDAAAAIEALVDLVRRKFDEE